MHYGVLLHFVTLHVASKMQVKAVTQKSCVMMSDVICLTISNYTYYIMLHLISCALWGYVHVQSYTFIQDCIQQLLPHKTTKKIICKRSLVNGLLAGCQIQMIWEHIKCFICSGSGWLIILVKYHMILLNMHQQISAMQGHFTDELYHIKFKFWGFFFI